MAFFIGKIGVRKVAILAAIVHVIGFAVSSFAQRLWHVIPSFAVFCGKLLLCNQVLHFQRFLTMN